MVYRVKKIKKIKDVVHLNFPKNKVKKKTQSFVKKIDKLKDVTNRNKTFIGIRFI